MRYSCVAAALAAIGTLGAASNALAADCNFAGQNVVYVTGSSASSPYLQNLSPLLAAQSKPVTLVYIQTESCQGVTDFTTSTALTSSAMNVLDNLRQAPNFNAWLTCCNSMPNHGNSGSRKD